MRGGLELSLVRELLSEKATVGRLTVRGTSLVLFTLEDAVRRGVKVPGATAIPAGSYPVRLCYSPRFHRDLPLLFDVRGFRGVRIHAGNTVEHTRGCILVGRACNFRATPPELINSLGAMDDVLALFRAHGQATIHISEPAPPGTGEQAA